MKVRVTTMYVVPVGAGRCRICRRDNVQVAACYGVLDGAAFSLEACAACRFDLMADNHRDDIDAATPR